MSTGVKWVLGKAGCFAQRIALHKFFRKSKAQLCFIGTCWNEGIVASFGHRRTVRCCAYFISCCSCECFLQFFKLEHRRATATEHAARRSNYEIVHYTTCITIAQCFASACFGWCECGARRCYIACRGLVSASGVTTLCLCSMSIKCVQEVP